MPIIYNSFSVTAETGNSDGRIKLQKAIIETLKTCLATAGIAYTETITVDTASSYDCTLFIEELKFRAGLNTVYGNTVAYKISVLNGEETERALSEASSLSGIYEADITTNLSYIFAYNGGDFVFATSTCPGNPYTLWFRRHKIINTLNTSIQCWAYDAGLGSGMFNLTILGNDFLRHSITDGFSEPVQLVANTLSSDEGAVILCKQYTSGLWYYYEKLFQASPVTLYDIVAASNGKTYLAIDNVWFEC